MRKATGVCYIDRSMKTVIGFVLHTRERNLINLSATKHSYTNTYELVEYCVYVAKQNGFDIPYYENFGAKTYDIIFVDKNTGDITRFSML